MPNALAYYHADSMFMKVMFIVFYLVLIIHVFVYLSFALVTVRDVPFILCCLTDKNGRVERNRVIIFKVLATIVLPLPFLFGINEYYLVVLTGAFCAVPVGFVIPVLKSFPLNWLIIVSMSLSKLSLFNYIDSSVYFAFQG